MDHARPGAYKCTLCLSNSNEESSDNITHWKIEIRGVDCVYQENVQAMPDGLYHIARHNLLEQSIPGLVKCFLTTLEGHDIGVYFIHNIENDFAPQQETNSTVACPMCNHQFTDVHQAMKHCSSCRLPSQHTNPSQDAHAPFSSINGTEYSNHEIETPTVLNKSVLSSKLWIEARNRYKQNRRDIVAKCQQLKQPFVDSDFPPIDRSIRTNFCTSHEIRWKRLRDFSQNSMNLVVYDNPMPADVIQGRIGNCWFMSALSVLAERTDLVRNLFFQNEICPYGVYQVRLCKDGVWKVIIVDDYVPSSCDRVPIYSSISRNQIWVPLLEKAMAKLHGSYEALSSGTICEGFSTLTGAPCVTIYMDSDMDFDETWVRLSSCHDAGYLMGASIDRCRDTRTKEEYHVLGLMIGHAYSVLQVRQLDGNRLIQLRNPTATISWRGRWADDSITWSPSLRQELQPNRNAHGIFWMCWEDMCCYFNAIDVCKIQQDYYDARATGFFAKNTTDEWTGFYLTLSKPDALQITLYQSGLRAVHDEYITQDMGIMLFRIDERETNRNNALRHAILVSGTNRKVDTRHSHETDVLRPGLYFVLPYSLNALHSEAPRRQFVISLHSSKQLSLMPYNITAVQMGDCLVKMVVKLGKAKNRSDLNATLYNYETMFAAINHNPTHFFICTIEVTDYSNMVSSRELLFVQTSISPKCQQLIVCYTCQIAEHSSNITYKCSVRMSTKEGENVPPTLSNDMHHQQYTIEAIDLSLQRIQDRQRQQQQEQKPLMSPERFCSPQ